MLHKQRELVLLCHFVVRDLFCLISWNWQRQIGLYFIYVQCWGYVRMFSYELRYDTVRRSADFVIFDDREAFQRTIYYVARILIRFWFVYSTHGLCDILTHWQRLQQQQQRRKQRMKRNQSQSTNSADSADKRCFVMFPLMFFFILFFRSNRGFVCALFHLIVHDLIAKCMKVFFIIRSESKRLIIYKGNIYQQLACSLLTGCF